MEFALPEARVVGFHRHIDSITLPDRDDRHVVAATIEENASHILTWNLRDFPVNATKRHGLARATPDALIVDTL
jgi:hypothetical protein